MQAHPPSIPHHPPVAPSIPPSVAHLIPRLRAAINDIDIFQNMVARGAIDSSMPDWDSLLRQYSLLTGRLNALSSFLTESSSTAQQALPGPSRAPIVRPPTGLAQSLVEPLNPLPADSDILTQASFFESLNTMPLIPLSAHTADLLSSEPWVSQDQLRGMTDEELERLRDSLRDRLKVEKRKAEALSAEVENQAEAYEWEMRVDDGAAEGEEEAERTQSEEEEDDLFRGDSPADKEDEQQLGLHPRSGWSLVDYVSYIDSGKVPVVKA